MSRALGSISFLSRASWSVGVVVLSPHPGQGKPGQFTQDEGEVSARPATVLYERIFAGPPTSYHRLVVALLSLSSIICCTSIVTGRQCGAVAFPLRHERLQTSSSTTLASYFGLPRPTRQSGRCRYVDGGQTVPARFESQEPPSFRADPAAPRPREHFLAVGARRGRGGTRPAVRQDRY